MKHELSTLELQILIGELNAVKGYYIDQFYEVGENRFRFKLSSKEGKVNLNMEIPYYIALSKSAEVAEEATGFAMAVRKRVSGARIANISLLNNDRILKIDVERKDSAGSFIIEMFGRGNLIITDEKMITLLALQTHEFADRQVRKGEEYTPPQNQSVNLKDEAAVKAVFKSIKDATGSDKLISYLSRKLGLGTMYLEDAIKRQGVDPKIKIKDVDQKTLDKIEEKVEMVIKEGGKAILYLKDGVPEQVAVTDIEKYKELDKKEMPLNEAIETLYTSIPRERTESNAEVEKLESSLKRQSEIIEEMRKEEIACRAKGEFISTNVATLNTLIKLTGSKKASDDELKSIGKGFTIKRVDRAKRALIIETDDAK
jgi:predicted ribosome quality control (RQC) complex YloA/Tae2 family protein